LLDVNGTIGAGTAGGVAIQLANGAAIRNSAAVANTIYFDTSFGSATHGSFEFRSSNAGTTRMLIDSSGRVGIGTSSPATLLDLSSTTAAKLNLTYPGFGIATLASDSTGALLLQADEANTQASSLIQFKVDGSERVRIDSSGRVGIGTQTPSWIFDVKTATGYIGFNTSGGLGSQIRFANSSNVNTAAISNNGGSNELLQFDINNNAGAGQIVFNTVGSERARIDSSGRLLVGTSSYDGNARAVFAGNTSDNATGAIDIRRNTARPTAANTQIGALRFISNDNTSSNYGYASIDVFTDGASSSNTDIPGRLVFSTTADGASSPTEALRINSAQRIGYGSTVNAGGVNTTAYLTATSGATNNASGVALECYASSTAARFHISFSNGNGVVGSISTSGTATSFTTSSDYRLKENIIPLTGASERVLQLKPSRFNFIADPDIQVDGFIAHEAQAVVPECVTGAKDEVDEDGNPVYQGIDQSKLVPLLTAALQEAIGRIETLEAEVAALKGA
jgi:hypothetical protein